MRRHTLLLGLALSLAARGALAQRVVEVRATPARAVLGETSEIQITVRGAGALRAVVNVGSVGPVHNGRATYTLPANRRPQVALVLVHGDGVAGAVAIPLLGRTELPVQTEPNASVVLEAGGERFGPVVADGSGRATIPLRLPPGVRSGTIVARDRVGNETRRPANLNVPDVDRTLAVRTGDALVAGGAMEATVAFAAAGPQGALLGGTAVSSEEIEVVSQRAGPGVLVATVRARTLAGRLAVAGQFGGARATIALAVAPAPAERVQVTSDPARVPADGRTKPTVRAAAVDRFGNAVGGDPPRVQVEGATVEETERDGGAAVVTLAARDLGPGGAAPGPARIRAEGAGFATDLVLEWFDPDAVLVSVTLDPPSLVAGAGGPVKVHVVARDGRGRPPDGSAPLDLESDVIRPPSPIAFVAGEASFEIPAPTRAGRHVLHARVGDAQGAGMLEVLPAAATRLRARFDPARVEPGQSTALHVEALDRFGNRVPGVAPVARAERLAIGRFRDEAGEAVGRVRLRIGENRRAIAVRIEAAGLSGRARLDVAGAAPFFAGASVGIAHNFGELTSFPLALEIGWRPPLPGRPMSFAFESRYAAGSGEADVEPGPTVPFETRHLLVAGVFAYRLTFGRFEPFAELVAGAAFTRSAVTPTVGATDRRSGTSPSVEAGAGLDLALGPGRVHLVLRYGYLPLSPPLDGSATGLLTLAGYRIDL